jgi:hypothetical protein
VSHPKLNVLLWIVQAALALLFALTGSLKLLLPADVLAAQAPLPVIVVRLVGMFELAGALGLVLPGLLRIRAGLTPLAATGLVLLMVSAALLTSALLGGDLLTLLIPILVGLLAALVAYGRWRLIPLPASAMRVRVRFAN